MSTQPTNSDDRPCYRCGTNPAAGYASIWTAANGERWYCHGDDETYSCYERADTVVEPTATPDPYPVLTDRRPLGWLFRPGRYDR